MLKRLASLTLPVACIAAAACGATSADAKLAVGIGDNNPAMFSQPLFTKMHVSVAREIVFWDVATNAKEKAYLTYAGEWIKAAQADGIQPLVSFGGDGNYIPNVKQYTTAVKAFIKDFPSVKLYTAWNEPDWVYRSLSKNPKLAAQFFNALYGVCRGCTVAAGELYRPVNDGLAAWIKAYKRALKVTPKAWALHPYDDVRTMKTSQIQTLEHYIGTKTPIWLTEISGLLRRGHWPYPNQSAQAAANDEKFLFELPKRFHNITAIYHYQWQGTVPSPSTGWDSGLINPNGTPRPAYNVVYNAAHGKLP